MKTPWYKQFWPWFIIALPSCAVIASFATLYIAVSSENDLVVESYYKKGKAINADLSLVRAAEALAIEAVVSQQNDRLVLDINLPEKYQNQPLQLQLAHRTLAKHDRHEVITADAQGLYRFGQDLTKEGRWFLSVRPMDEAWILQEELNLPLANAERIDGK